MCLQKQTIEETLIFGKKHCFRGKVHIQCSDKKKNTKHNPPQNVICRRSCSVGTILCLFFEKNILLVISDVYFPSWLYTSCRLSTFLHPCCTLLSLHCLPSSRRTTLASGACFSKLKDCNERCTGSTYPPAEQNFFLLIFP